MRYNLEHCRCYSAIFAPRALARFLECLSFFKLESTVKAIIWLNMYSFFMIPECFFYECEMMINVFFHDTDRLGNTPHSQGGILKMVHDFLPDGLFCYIDHITCFYVVFEKAGFSLKPGTVAVLGWKKYPRRRVQYHFLWYKANLHLVPLFP